jgi:hypothetical protein
MYVKSNSSKIQRSSADVPCHQKEISPLSALFQNHKNMERTPKKPKHNASVKSIDTGIESVPPVDIENTTSSADAGNANMVVASCGTHAVVESETHDNARNAVNALPSTAPAMAKLTQVMQWKQG